MAFKADVDDLRESPALDIVKELMSMNIADLAICEPNLNKHPEFELVSLEESLKAADIVLLLVDHKQFKRLSAAQLSDKIVIDTRGIIH